MPSAATADRIRRFARSTLVLVIVAGASFAAGVGFVAGALQPSPMSPAKISAAFAPSARAAEPGFPGSLRASGTVAQSSTGGSAHFDEPQVPQPRECDLAKGISTECLWLD